LKKRIVKVVLRRRERCRYGIGMEEEEKVEEREEREV
jgi:hypothetical protein